MTDPDRCAQTYPHPAHRTQYGPLGVKDCPCPGIPITPANAPTVPDGPAPASTLPGTVRGVGIAFQRPEMRVGEQLRALEHRLGQLEDRVDEHLTPSEYDPADDEPETTPAYVHHLIDAYLTGQPLNFHGADVPADVQRRLEHALTVPAPAWSAMARELLLAELTGGKRPCPWCDGAPVFDSREDLLTHARRHHFDAPYPAEEMVWLGDLSGYWIEAPDHEHPLLRHRCGWAHEITSPARGYLANLLTGPVEAHRDAGCNPHED